MDIRTVLRLLRERWLTILALTLLSAAIATVVVVRQTPRYAAEATLYVSARADADNPASAYQGSLLSQQKVSSYAQLIRSQRVLDEAAGALGSGETGASLAARIVASVVPETSLLVITATDTSPAGAQQTANAVAQRFVAVLPALEGTAAGGTPTVVVSVVNAAALPTRPVAPTPVRTIGLGALLGLLVGVALAALRQSLDLSVASAEQAQQAAQAPVLGSVPADPSAPRSPLAIGQQAHRGRVEALRKISASLRFMDVDRRHGVVLITSPHAQEGKSTTACNLALTLSRTGRRVILIDGDLRRPQIGEYLGLPSGVGLTDILVGTASVTEATQVWGDNAFDVIASGPVPPNPSELLGSQPMRALLTQLRAEYDDVVVDVPPVLPVADAAIAAAACDGVILVARHGRTRRDRLQQAAATIRTTETPILGVILNRAPTHNRSDHYYSYYQAGGAEHRLERPESTALPEAVR